MLLAKHIVENSFVMYRGLFHNAGAWSGHPALAAVIYQLPVHLGKTLYFE